MNIDDLLSIIRHNNFTNDELNRVAEAVRFAKANIANQVKRELVIGDTVSFKTKTGMTYTGKVQKKAIKFATISASGGLWRVPMSMLTRV